MVTLAGALTTGGVVSRTVIVCTELVLFPFESVAVQRRETTLVPPQPLLTVSLQVIVTELQASVAVATPVLLVDVSLGHSSTRSVGTSNEGGLVSRTVICCTQVLLLPQASVAVQVRLITLVVLPGKTGGWVGNGPKGGWVCGGGSGPIFDRFPSESVWTPTLIGTGG